MADPAADEVFDKSVLDKSVFTSNNPRWAERNDLKLCGLYFQGFDDSFFSQHCLSTVSTFGVRKSRKTAAVDNKVTCPESHDDVGNETSKVF